MAKAFPESLLEFEHWFRTEESCRDYLAKLRWPEGFICPRCGKPGAWTMGQPYSRCHGCLRDVSATAGTIFHRSHISLKTWFRIAWWATNQKSGLSAKGLQGLLGLSSYKTSWTALQKLRRAMIRPDREKLSGDVEVDKTAVGGHKRGGNSLANKAIVIIAVEIRGEGMGRVRLRRLRGPLAEPILEFVEQTVEDGSTIVTDGEWAFRLVKKRGCLLYTSPSPRD